MPERIDYGLTITVIANLERMLEEYGEGETTCVWESTFQTVGMVRRLEKGEEEIRKKAASLWGPRALTVSRGQGFSESREKRVRGQERSCRSYSRVRLGATQGSMGVKGQVHGVGSRRGGLRDTLKRLQFSHCYIRFSGMVWPRSKWKEIEVLSISTPGKLSCKRGRKVGSK